MGALYKTRISSDLPKSHTETEFDMGDDPVTAAVYTNLAYDLYAAATAKLGWEFTKWIAGEQDRSAMEKEVGTALKSLSVFK